MIRSIIIDDEPDGREALRIALQKYCPEVEILALCPGPEEGIQAINSQKPELVFLDVQMPHKSGFNVLEELGDFDFEVIFVTAFDRYAVKAIKFSALDYLLKPVDVDELQKAVQKAAGRLNRKGFRINYESLIKNMKNPSGRIEKLAIPDAEGIVFEKVTEILFCEADGNYTKIHLTGKRQLLVSKNLKDFENMLSESNFFRIHHAFLVNLQHIRRYVKGEGGYVILEEGHHVDVSRRKKDSFLQLLHKVGN